MSTLTFTAKLNGNLVLVNGKLSTTWVKQHLDNILTCRTRHWLNLHPGANIDHLKQSTTNFLPCQTTTRRILSQLKNPDVLKI